MRVRYKAWLEILQAGFFGIVVVVRGGAAAT
jgi:hypothetical protein